MNIKELLESNNLNNIKLALDISDIHYNVVAITDINIKIGYRSKYKKLLQKNKIKYNKNSYYRYYIIFTPETLNYHFC